MTSARVWPALRVRVRVLFAFADDALGVFVDAQSEEDRLAQDPFTRPFGERDLGDQLRLHPMRRRVRLRPLDEGRGLAFERFELCHQRAQELRVEAGAHVAGVFQLAAVVIADQQRTELLAAPARFGPAADDELLTALGLDLHPFARADRTIRRGAHLTDDPLEAALLGLREELL